jgi:hypothetical protein
MNRSNYEAFVANCRQTVNITLKGLNIPTHPNVLTSQFSEDGGWPLGARIAPNMMYIDILSATENMG